MGASRGAGVVPGKFGSPTSPQELGWPPILDGRPTLISAPTGSGKTLAAFLICIDKLIRQAIDGSLAPAPRWFTFPRSKRSATMCRRTWRCRCGRFRNWPWHAATCARPIRTAVRTGDTLPAERRAMLKRPPHILVTTPESLYILLTAEKSRQNLCAVETVIVDEIHAVADDKRGAHLTLTLERLDALVCGENRLSPGTLISGRSQPPLRIGLSATQNPIELVASFLGGRRGPEVAIVQVGQHRALDLGIEVPGEELGSVATNAIWDDIYERMAELALQHRSTLVFVNTRAMAERLAFCLGERLGPENVAAHHGSLSQKASLGSGAQTQER